MTEADWLECSDPGEMLEFLHRKSSARKLRLFAVGCCRQFWHLLDNDFYGYMVEAAERFADGQETAEKLNDLWNMGVEDNGLGDPQNNVKRAAIHAIEWWREQHQMASNTAYAAAFVVTGYQAASDEQSFQARHSQSNLLRDIVGDPFRPMTIDTAWLTSTVVSLAQGIYEDRAFDRLPILADALEDAGCMNEEILNHCREPGEHARGCWAVDLLLGKQ